MQTEPGLMEGLTRLLAVDIISRMATTKPKQPGQHAPTWSNKVVRTSDGRLIVRGVDVPASGAIWERVLAGAPLPPLGRPAAVSGSYVLDAVTSKSKALATAKRAGLVLVKPKPAKK